MGKTTISTEQKILALLRKDTNSFLSGQILSNTLNISRTAIWKQIHALKDLGYDINASPAKGYRLNIRNLPFNKNEILSNLETSFIGRNLLFYTETSSTNDIAKELAANGAEQGTAIIADCQKKGRGRIGRCWESPAGVNIYSSIILRPDILPIFASQLTLVSAVAVADTISEYSSIVPEVKWPNDILINSKKTAGILTEMNSETDRINFIVIGIGVNLNMTKKNIPDGLRQVATSIKEETGNEVSRIEFIQSLYMNMEKWYKEYLNNGFDSVSKAWTGYFRIKGKMVKVHQTDRVIEGTALGIDSNGALLLKEQNGNISKIISGDIEI